MRAAAAFALLLLLALAAAACGGPGSGELEKSRARAEKQHGEDGAEKAKSEEKAADEADAEPEAPADEKDAEPTDAAPSADALAAGKDLFASSCGSCHVLADAGSTGTVGPSMDDLKPNADLVRTQIENGGGTMPPGLLQGEDADTVADYVAAVAGK